VIKIDRKIDSGFARIVLAPAAQSDGVRHVLVLEPTGVRLPPRPQPAASESAAAGKAAAKKASRK
jgi:rod shape-determining protein MreC